MANEELWKRLHEAAKKAAASAGGAEQQPVAPQSGQESQSPQEKPTTDSTTGVIEAAKEKLSEFTRKLKSVAPEGAKRIIGNEDDLPKDARVLSIVEVLLEAPEEQLADPSFMREVGNKLVGVIHETGQDSMPAREARKYLDRIISQNPSLSDLALRATPEVFQEHDVVTDDSGGQEESGGNVKLREEVQRLYDATTDDDLSNTPLAKELTELQYRFRVDPGAVYDTRLTDDAVRRMIEKGKAEGLSEGLIQKAVERVRYFERFTDLQVQKHREKLQGGRSVTWSEVMGHAPKSELREPDDVFTDFRYMTPSDVETIIHGDEGEAKWYFDFIDQIYSMGREETRPTLTHEQRFQEFKDYLVWKYGSEYHLAVQLYQKHWDSRGQFEYAVKGLMYNPGDIKDRLKAMSFLQGADLDHLYKNFEHSNEAYSLYEHVMFELMAEKRAKYGEALTYLDEEIRWNKKMMKRKDVLTELKKKQKEEGYDPEKKIKTASPLSVEDQRLMLEIQQQMDLASEGVMLWDDDVQSYTELHITLSKLRNRREELLQKKSSGKEMTESEADQLHEVDRLYEIYAHREDMLNESFTQELLETRGLSPVDIEVRKRLKTYLKAQTGKEPAEYEVRMALWAARTAMIGSGRMAMIGSMMSVPPSQEYHAASGKDVMRAPAFEDLQRIFNPEVFAGRFNIGGEMGVTARGILRKNLFRTKGITEKDPKWYQKIGGGLESLGHKLKLTKTHEWQEHKAHEHDEQKRAAMEAWEFAEDATGISFSELLGPGFMASGGFYDGTAWRLEKGIADELRNKILDMKKMPQNAALLDNQALSIQLLVAGNAAERRPILDRMLRRNPSKFLELLTEDTEKILTKHAVTHKEWKKFKEALSLAEMRLAHEKEWQYARVDLAEKKDFDALVVPFLQTLQLDPSRAENFRQVLSDLQAEVYRPRPIEAAGGSFRNKMDAIAQLKMPLTMSLTDMDWKESNFYQLGTVAMHRRIRDVGAQMRARDAMLALMSNQEMALSPNDPLKSLEKIKEVREAIIDYSGPEAAENTAKEMMRMLIEMNRHRHLWSIGMVPGLTSLAKIFAEADLRRMKGSFLLTPIRLIMGREKWAKLVDEKLAHLPHSVAEKISYSLRYTGAHGNAWDEKKIEEVLVSAHDMGMFIHHPEYIHDLRQEFKATWGHRMLAMARTYWWVLLAATIAIAAEQSIEEQKGGGGGGGHH